MFVAKVKLSNCAVVLCSMIFLVCLGKDFERFRSALHQAHADGRPPTPDELLHSFSVEPESQSYTLSERPLEPSKGKGSKDDSSDCKRDQIGDESEEWKGLDEWGNCVEQSEIGMLDEDQRCPVHYPKDTHC
eukprot:5757642-Amphidinium_carterae.1